MLCLLSSPLTFPKPSVACVEAPALLSERSTKFASSTISSNDVWTLSPSHMAPPNTYASAAVLPLGAEAIVWVRL